MGIVQIIQESTERLLGHFESLPFYWNVSGQLSRPCASWAAAPTNRKGKEGKKGQWALPGHATANAVGTWSYFEATKTKMRRGQVKVEQQDGAWEGDGNLRNGGKQAKVEKAGKIQRGKEGGNSYPKSTARHWSRAPSPWLTCLDAEVGITPHREGLRRSYGWAEWPFQNL